MLVTVVGTGRSVVLAEGERIRVERTPYVDNLIRQGFAVMAGVHTDEGTIVTPKPVLSDTQTAEFDAYVAKAAEFADALDGAPYPYPIEPQRPQSGANKQAWRDYLDSVGISYPAEATKTELIELADG